MSFSRLLRQVASADSVRYQDDEFDLNLTYITPKIIGMGFPASGVEGMYRNSIVDVSKFLIEKHNGNFMVWNLSERSYDYSLFNDQVLDFGFPDHHNPPLLLLFTIIHSMHAWISADPNNVAVVHCLAGKGRTGTIIACYLLYAGLVKTPTEALDFYASRRSHQNKGVTRPSQKQYVQYFYEVCFDGKSYKGIPKHLRKIEFGPASWMATELIEPIIIIDQMSSDCELPNDGEQVPAKVTKQRVLDTEESKESYFVEENQTVFNLQLAISGDTVLRCKHYTRYWRREVFLFRTSFHTSFIPDSNILVVPRFDVGLANKDERFSDDFTLTLYFDDLDEPVEGENTNAKWNEETCNRFLATARSLRDKAESENSFLKFEKDSPRGLM